MAAIRLVKGTERSGRGAHVNACLAAHPDTTLLLVPTRTSARIRLERILRESGLPGLWGGPVLSLEDFAKRLVEGEGSLVIEIDELERRLLLEGVVSRLRVDGKLDALGDASDSTGFINHMLFVIAQLKQAAVEPAQFRAALPQRARPSWLDPIVADVYEAYQDALVASGKYDRIGLYWQASLIAADGRPKGLASVTSIILDGFDDFTPSEFRLIKSLAPHLDTLVFGMVSSDMPTQQDLYALPLATEKTIRRTFEVADTQTFPEDEPETYVHVAAARLFARDTFPLPEGVRPNIEILTCGDATHEVEVIGRRVKSLLLEGVPPDRIAVAYRSTRDAAPILRSQFREFGIPASFSAPIPLAETSLARYLTGLIDAVEKWPRDSVIDILLSPWHVPDEAHAPYAPAMASIARAAGIIEGRKEWLTRLAALAARLSNPSNEWDESLLWRIPDASSVLADLQSRVEAFASFADAFPQTAAPLAYIEACRAILQGGNIDQAIAGIVCEDDRTLEAAARDELLGLLNRLEAWCERPEARKSLSRGDFVALLRREMAAVPVPETAPRVAVRCVDLDMLRHARYDHVFLAGLNEGECPRPPAIRVIYGEEDVSDWRAAGVELDSKRKWADREMLIFHQAVCSAEQRLCLTSRTVSPNGRSLSPSPFMAALSELFPGADLRHSSDAGKGFVPEFDAVASWRDVRNAAFFHGDNAVAPFAQEFAATRAGSDIERRRQSSANFDAYDGVVSGDEALAILNSRFGKSQVFGVRQIESYAECPYQFFLTHVLRVEPEQTPAAELDPAVRGVLMHRVLEIFHRRYQGRSVADIPAHEASEAMREIVAEVFRGGLVRGAGAPQGTVEAERRALTCKLNRYLSIARCEDEAEWKPSYFEVSFGPGRGASDAPPSTLNAFVLETPAGPVKFAGRIDRIDRSGDAVRIIDYKTSVHVQTRHIRDGVALQMPVYALALEQHVLQGDVCELAYLVAVGRKERREALARAKGEWETRAETATTKIGWAVTQIREGQFPPVPYERMCNLCAGRRVCRHEAGRIERKTEPSS